MTTKSTKYFRLIGAFALLLLIACEPMIDDKPDAGLVLPPSANEMDFSITAGEDAFRFNVELTSPSLSGIAQVTFDFGNGSKATGKSGSAYYPLPDDYTITMTIKTNSGSTSISKVHTTTETDYSIFTDPLFIAISGGVDALDGKTWVIDSLTAGHLGVGQPDLYEPNWWSAPVLGKAGHFIYDDEFTFNLNGFTYDYNSHGATHVNGDGGAADRGIAIGYYTNIIWEDAFDKDVLTNDAAIGATTWLVSEEGDKTFIILSNSNAHIGYDDGNERKYEVLSFDENSLYLRSEGANARYHKLIPKGYERPSVTFDVSFDAGTDQNSYQASVLNVNIPAGQSIDKVLVDFGDGTVLETTDYNEVLNNVYMRKGTYPVKVTVTTSVGSKESTYSVTIAENHPDYVPFLLDQQVMYIDFSEVQLSAVIGQDCDLFVADNPDRTYPNKSSKVAFYSKTGQEWANAFMKLPAGHRFDLRQVHTFKMMVYGKAGDVVLLKLENTDKGGDAWQTGTEITYTIQQDNIWEVAEYNFEGASVQAGSEDWKWWSEPVSYDMANDDFYNHDFYNIIRIMLNPGNADGTHEFYFDELAGPHVEGLKSAIIDN